MYRSGQQGEEALLEELSRKEDDLLRAARYGKSLLEEKGRMATELRSLQEERSNFEEVRSAL